MTKIIITTAEVVLLFVLATVGLFLTVGDCNDLSTFIWSKVLAVSVWLTFVGAFVAFDKDGALTSRLPKSFMEE